MPKSDPDTPPGLRAGVLGSPIAHSLSPLLHNAAYAALGLPWRYAAYAVPEHELADFLRNLDATWAGLSLTMPLKRAVLPLLDEISDLALQVGAANTVLVRPGDAGVTLLGDNTDVPGMVAACRAAGVRSVHRPAILGAGATACSALAAVRELGATEVTVAVRDTARARTLLEVAEVLGLAVSLTPWQLPHDADLVIATTPKGSTDALAGVVPAEAPPLFDVLYDPWPTPLAAAWATQGVSVIAGFELLLHQAARQVELMTGRRAPLEEMRAAAISARDRAASRE